MAYQSKRIDTTNLAISGLGNSLFLRLQKPPSRGLLASLAHLVTGALLFPMFAQGVMARVIDIDERQENIVGVIESPEEVIYRFSATAGDKLLVTLSDFNETDTDTNFTPTLALLTPAGSVLAEDSDSIVARLPSGVASTLSLPESGTYSLRLSRPGSLSTPGDYRLDFNLIPGAFDGPQLVDEATIDGSLERGEVLVYSFVGVPGQHVVASLVGTSTSFPEVFFGPLIEVYNPLGTKIDSDLPGLFSSVINSAGPHMLLIRDVELLFASDYRLDFARLPGAKSGGALQSGVPVSGSLVEKELRAFQLELDAGDTVVASLSDAGSLGTFNPMIDLYSPSGERLMRGVSPPEIDFRAQVGGIHTLLISGAETSSGAEFRLDYHRIPGALDSGLLRNSALVDDTWLPGEIKSYGFFVSDGDQIRITMSEGQFLSQVAPRLVLYGPDGAELARNESASSAELTGLISGDAFLTLLAWNRGGGGPSQLSISGISTPDDSDDDGWPASLDNCPNLANPSQLDTDTDGAGDECDADDDGDGLSDIQENGLGTDSKLPDSDSDGFSDFDEVDAGTDPLSADDQPIPPGLNLILIQSALDAK